MSEPNYHTKMFFTEHPLVIDTRKKTEIILNKAVYLGLLILKLSKTLMYKSWYNYVKPKNCEKATLCNMDTDSFIVHIKTDDIYKDIPEGAQTRFDT